MASPVGAILFLLPITLPISYFHLPLQFPTSQAATRCCRIVFHAGSPAERQLFRTDFRFAPSPRRASLAGPPIHEDMVVHGLCGRVPDSAGNACSLNYCCSGIANLSAHLHRLPTPPPCLRRMRLSPGRGAGIRWVMMLAPGRGWSSSKSPSTDAKVNYLVIRYLYFRSVRGGLNLCSPSTSAKVNCLVIRYLHFWSVRGDLLEGSGYASRCQFLLFLCRSTFFPSTKSRFLCAFCLRDPRFRAFRAQNRCICALFAFGPPPF